MCLHSNVVAFQLAQRLSGTCLADVGAAARLVGEARRAEALLAGDGDPTRALACVRALLSEAPRASRLRLLLARSLMRLNPSPCYPLRPVTYAVTPSALSPRGSSSACAPLSLGPSCGSPGPSCLRLRPSCLCLHLCVARPLMRFAPSTSMLRGPPPPPLSCTPPPLCCTALHAVRPLSLLPLPSHSYSSSPLAVCPPTRPRNRHASALKGPPYLLRNTPPLSNGLRRERATRRRRRHACALKGPPYRLRTQRPSVPPALSKALSTVAAP